MEPFGFTVLLLLPDEILLSSVDLAEHLQPQPQILQSPSADQPGSEWACRRRRPTIPTEMTGKCAHHKSVVHLPPVAQLYQHSTPSWWKSTSVQWVCCVTPPKSYKNPASLLSGRAQRGTRWGLHGAPPVPLTRTWCPQPGGCCTSLGCRSHWLSGPWTRTGGRTAPLWRTGWRRSGRPLNPASKGEPEPVRLKCLPELNLTRLYKLMKLWSLSYEGNSVVHCHLMISCVSAMRSAERISSWGHIAKCTEVQNPGNMSESSASSVVVKKSQEIRLYHSELFSGWICT